MSTSQPTTSTKVTILKHLLAGRNADWIAAAVPDASHADIDAVKRDHGYPDDDKMRWALDILEKRDGAIPTKATTTIPAARPVAPPTGSRDRGAGPRPTAPPAAEPAHPQPATAGYTVTALADRAKKSDKAATRRLGERLTDLADRLVDALADETRRRDAAAKKAAADADRKRKIAELEAQLAALKGKPAAKKKTSAAAAPSEAKLIRQWAADQGIPCPAVGRIPAAVREQYDAAHQQGAA